MTAFDPATIRLLREQLRLTDVQHRRDLLQRTKQPANAKSKVARALDKRIGESLRVSRDLSRLITLMEALNAEEPDAIAPIGPTPEPYDFGDLGSKPDDSAAVLAEHLEQIGRDTERCVCGCDNSATECFCGQNCECNALDDCPICDGNSEAGL